MMIKTAIRLGNDMVMTFDEEGEQMPWYQGNYHDVKDKILGEAPAAAVFYHWFDDAPKPDMVESGSW